MESQTDTVKSSKPLGIAYLIGRLDHMLNLRIRDCLAPFGVSVSQYTALAFLDSQGPLSNAQLAERSFVTPQAANEMVKHMNSRGWIVRQADASHGRIIHISLTAEGRTLLQQCDAAVTQVEANMLTELPPEARTELHGKLRTLIRALSVMVADPDHF